MYGGDAIDLAGPVSFGPTFRVVRSSIRAHRPLPQPGAVPSIEASPVISERWRNATVRTIRRFLKPLLAGGYLLHDHPDSGPKLHAKCSQVQGKVDASTCEDVIRQVDVAGHGNHARRAGYPARASVLPAGSRKLGRRATHSIRGRGESQQEAVTLSDNYMMACRACPASKADLLPIQNGGRHDRSSACIQSTLQFISSTGTIFPPARTKAFKFPPRLKVPVIFGPMPPV
jgi:hypothetical protein